MCRDEVLILKNLFSVSRYSFNKNVFVISVAAWFCDGIMVVFPLDTESLLKYTYSAVIEKFSVK